MYHNKDEKITKRAIQILHFQKYQDDSILLFIPSSSILPTA